jgi:putative membrane protein
MQGATMKRTLYLMTSCLCTALAISPPLQAKDQADAIGNSASALTTPSAASTVSAIDKDLMSKLAFANLSEISTANLALKKSSNETVKAFAQHMIDDHTKATEELKALAQRKNVVLPAEPDAQHAAAAKKMALMSGSAFDRLYLHEAGMVDHRATLQLLEHIGRHAKDNDLKALAQKLTPTVVAHLDMVRKDTAAAGSDATKASTTKSSVTRKSDTSAVE